MWWYYCLLSPPPPPPAAAKRGATHGDHHITGVKYWCKQSLKQSEAFLSEFLPTIWWRNSSPQQSICQLQLQRDQELLPRICMAAASSSSIACTTITTCTSTANVHDTAKFHRPILEIADPEDDANIAGAASCCHLSIRLLWSHILLSKWYPRMDATV
jgi:hypothetical protein